jgi:hypothetical protein
MHQPHLATNTLRTRMEAAHEVLLEQSWKNSLSYLRTTSFTAKVFFNFLRNVTIRITRNPPIKSEKYLI